MLFDQIKGKKKKNSNEIFVENPNSLYVTKNEPRKSYDEKKWLDEIIKKKKETTEIKLRNKVIEHQEMKMRWNSEEEAAVNKQKENRKRRKEFAKEQFLQASVMKKTNHLIKELEKQHNRVLIEERIRKLDETETRKVEMVSNRIKFVHDEERLKKLVIPNQLPQNTMKKAEVEYKDGLVEETSPRTKKKNEEYLLLLQKQMEEKKKRDLEYSKVQEEQGKIWYDQDVKAHKEDYQKKVLKLKAQRSLHEEYTQNVQEKQKKRLESSLLSPCEVEINKKILESSIAILESNSPLGSFC